MFITLDGISGSGKSTQASLLKTHVPHLVDVNFYGTFRECITTTLHRAEARGIAHRRRAWRHLMRGVRPFAAIVAAFGSIPDEEDAPDIVVEHFWNSILYDLGLHSEAQVRRDARFILSCLSTRDRRLPTCSIWLSVPNRLQAMRREWRKLNGDRPMNHSDDRRRLVVEARDELWPHVALMESEYAWFHVIDGTGPPEAVTRHILRLLKEKSRCET